MTRLAPRPIRRCFFLSHESDTIDLLESGFAGLHQRHRRIAQRDGARGARRVLEFPCRGTRHDELPELVVQDDELADRLAALESGSAALPAAFAAAGFAQDSDEPLRENPV